MDGCLFAMEIVGNYINGPLFKQWASEMQKIDLNLRKQVRLLWKFRRWCFPFCNWILLRSLLLQGAEEASSWAKGCQQTKRGVFEKRGKLLLSAGQGEGGGPEAHRHSPLHMLHGFKVLNYTLLMSTFSAGEPDIYWDGLPLLQKEVHMDRREQLDHLVQPSQVETCCMCLMNTICVFQGLTPPLVTWLPSSWSCPCLFVLSSFMIWASLSSPSCLKYETLPFNAQFSWLLHGFKNPPYLIY